MRLIIPAAMLAYTLSCAPLRPYEPKFHVDSPCINNPSPCDVLYCLEDKLQKIKRERKKCTSLMNNTKSRLEAECEENMGDLIGDLQDYRVEIRFFAYKCDAELGEQDD